MRWHDPNEIQNAAAPAGAKLVLSGGRVVSHIQVVQVLYGSGSFLSQVSSTSTTAGASIGAFYRERGEQSRISDWLTNTTPTSRAAPTKRLDTDIPFAAVQINAGAPVGKQECSPRPDKTPDACAAWCWCLETCERKLPDP